MLRGYYMQNIQLINEIITTLGKPPELIIRKKFGKIPQMTVLDIVSRIILSGTSSVLEAFPEMNKDTIRKTLREVFGHVNLDGSKTWYLHLLSIVDKDRCPRCCNIYHSADICPKKRLCKLCVASDNTEYYQNNKASFLSRKLKRLDALKLATPAWANLSEMNRIYKECPTGYEVDHWAPIQGTNVCGLHNEFNLQYLSVEENRSKSNKFVIN